MTMRDFLLAALPWVLAGTAVVILCAGNGRKQEKDDERIAIGMCRGRLLGMLLNGCGLWENHAIGLALGPLWGMALANLTGGKKHHKATKNDSKS